MWSLSGEGLGEVTSVTYVTEHFINPEGGTFYQQLILNVVVTLLVLLQFFLLHNLKCQVIFPPKKILLLHSASFVKD